MRVTYYGWDSVTKKRWPLLWYTCQPDGESFFAKFFAQAPPQSIKLADMNALLHRAVSSRLPSLVELLLHHGGDINGCNDNGESLLICALDQYDLELCKVLTSRKINLNIRVTDRLTSKLSCALTRACRIPSGIRYVSLLLDAGADPNNCQPLNHIDYFHKIWQSETRRIARLLLEHGADPSAQDSEGENALMCAASSGNLEAIELMLNHGGD